MSDIKFTPGPWMPPASQKDLTVWATKNDRTEMIASTNTNQWCKEDEANANAKLIAAAPDLFEAAQYAMECLERLNTELGQIGDNGDQAYNVLKAAIDKALA